MGKTEKKTHLLAVTIDAGYAHDGICSDDELQRLVTFAENHTTPNEDKHLLSIIVNAKTILSASCNDQQAAEFTKFLSPFRYRHDLV